MKKLKSYLNKKEMLFAGFVIAGVLMLFTNLNLALYRNSTSHSEMAFQNDTISRSSDLNRVFNDMETMLSVFTTNVETMRINNITDRDLIVQMQKNILKEHSNVFGVGLIYEPDAYDGLDKEYGDNSLYNNSGVFMPHVWRNGDTFEVEPFYAMDGHDVYEDGIRFKTYNTTTGQIPTLGFYAPIHDETGKFIGMGGIHYEISFLKEYLREHVFNDTVCLIVTNKKGEIVASSLDVHDLADKEWDSILGNIADISASGMGEIQHIKTSGLVSSDFMVIANPISPVHEQGTYSDESQLILVHISERQSLLGFLATQGISKLNIVVAVITVISFMLLIASVLLRKKKDVLTGIYNREIIDNDLPKTIKEAIASQKDACLILADLDHFKNVNDTYGHMIGDIVLKSFSNIIRQCIRKKDWVARYGGEEFLIFLPETNGEVGREVAERIRKELEKSIVNSDGKNVKVTASFGVASLLQDKSVTAAELIKLADKNLYTAKETGRNKVC